MAPGLRAPTLGADMLWKESVHILPTYIAPELKVTEHLMEGREDELIAKIKSCHS